jgi:xanthine/CO dehydrogenase XdhC/CoxF family maturation factor
MGGHDQRNSATIYPPRPPMLYTELRPLPRLLVLGAGQDAVPVVNLADTLGWRVTLVDHRPAYLDRPGFAGAETRVCAPADELADRVPLPTFAAAIVMSHHLATDRRHLVTLAGSRVPYIGLLGPPGRRDRLLRELGTAAEGLAARLHGPAGLDIGADSPESIALAILAQIYAQFHGKTESR